MQNYTNPYIQKLNEAMAKVTGNYTYDPDTDPIASAYKKSYLREADRAMQNTLGEYATMTGGLPSTQAVAAASQSADNYKAQLALKMAELGQQAYDRDVSKVGMLMSAAQDADNRYYTALSSAMNRWAQLGSADEQVASVLGVPVGTMTSDAAYQQWQQAMAEKEFNSNAAYQQWQQAMNRWTQLGQADDQVASVLGVPVGTMTSDAAYQQWQQAMSEKEFNSNSAYQQWQQSLSEREYVLSLLASGAMPTSAQLSAAGISPEQAQQLLYQPSYGGGGGSGGSSSKNSGGKTVDWDTRAELGERYKTGGDMAIASQLDYLEAAGYDTQELMWWLMRHYQQGGYTGLIGPQGSGSAATGAPQITRPAGIGPIMVTK